MNRVIKFRAWDEGNKILYHDVQFIRTGIEGNDWICFASKENPYRVNNDGIILNNPFFSQQIKLMQFTGLKDNNGIEIYEGDVCKSLSHLFIAEFNVACFKLSNIKDRKKYWTSSSTKSVKVIGNIYENPELIK